MLSCEFLQDLYRSHSFELLRFARRRVGNQEAEDVLQDAYLHFLQRNPAESIQNPRAYLFRVTANAAIDWIRKSKASASRDPQNEIELDTFENAQAWGAETIYLLRLQLALSQLPAGQRKVFLLNRVKGLTYAEIALQLGVSVRTVDRYVLKAATFLREQLSEA